jgi:F0F1-type ATP synthase membrane subunit b/b'
MFNALFLKLQENLREAQELLQNTISRLQDVEKERNQLNEQLSKTVPQVCVQLTSSIITRVFFFKGLYDFNERIKSYA